MKVCCKFCLVEQSQELVERNQPVGSEDDFGEYIVTEGWKALDCFDESHCFGELDAALFAENATFYEFDPWFNATDFFIKEK